MGAEDRLCGRDRHDLMHELMPKSRLSIVAGAGHLPDPRTTRENDGGTPPLVEE
jgi:hypothetical protein